MENQSHHAHPGEPHDHFDGPHARRFSLWSWGVLRLGIFLIAGLVTLVAVIWVTENWRGKAAWERYKQAAETAGERFDLASYLPREVPPEQNLATTPFLAPLLDYEFVNGEVRWLDSNAVAKITSVHLRDAARSLGNWQKAEFTDLEGAQDQLSTYSDFPVQEGSTNAAEAVLFALGKYRAVFEELHQAKSRPFAVISSELDASPGVAVQHFGAMKSLNQVTVLRAIALLEAGRSADALAEVQLALRLAELVRSKPLLISHLVRVALIKSTLQPVWEGLAKRRWSEAELRQLQETLSGIDLFQEYGVAMRGERAFSCELMAQLIAGEVPGAPDLPPQPFRSFMPRGLLYQNQIAICKLFDGVILQAINDDEHRVYPEKCSESALKTVITRNTPYNLFARMLFPAIHKAAQQSSYAQSSLDFAKVACALERFRLAEGRYPDSLQPLVPRFAASLPPDVINGEALKYRLAENGSFVLYSVGWNRRDDDGQVSWKKRGGIDTENADWVWRYAD